MMENVSPDTLLTWMIWVHAGLLLVPLMIFTIKIEADDYRREHPKAPRRQMRPTYQTPVMPF